MSQSTNLYDIILGQYVTEKSSTAAEKFAQYTFKVARASDKSQIKRAIKHIYGVDVETCRVVNRPGKTKVRRGGKTKPFKLAYISLKSDQSIELAAQ
ncbi:50S ribosomal protein L23 [Gammaproteobacteria bacterium]|nr:50S ribosomal protein L23 [Gammaproteobacteria bacterium]